MTGAIDSECSECRRYGGIVNSIRRVIIVGEEGSCHGERDGVSELLIPGTR